MTQGGVALSTRCGAFCGVLGEGGHNHFAVTHENVFFSHSSSCITLDSWHYLLYLLLSQLGDASQYLAGVMALCLVLGREGWLSHMSYNVRPHK